MRFTLACALFAGACSSAYADRIAAPAPPAPRIAIAVANEKVRAPYDVQVIRENGETLPTYGMKDRYYVQGNANERYTIRVTNPTANRVEAVVSVDGLDVIDGESGDLRKRGYIVPAYGDVRIEGFRTSLQNVATFRFSAVDDSYAGQKGKARNVGVIAVAIFEEQAPEPQQIIVAPDNVPTGPRPYDWTDDLDGGAAPGWYRGAEASKQTRGGRDKGTTESTTTAKADASATRHGYKDSSGKKRVAEARPAEAPAPSLNGATGAGAVGSRVAPTTPAPPPPPRHGNYDEEADYGGDDYYEPAPNQAPKTNRQGLGTEFGEQRYSGASYTKFVRSATRPIAIAELRYNDAAGLTALGIMLQPLPDAGEIMLRETADPFPGDGRFSRPAR